MAISNLRTGITIRQERTSVSPNVQTTSLPVVLVGINRAIYYQVPANVFDWSAGTAAEGVEFPGFTSGTVEAGVANPSLKPTFFLKNSLGTVDITQHVTTAGLASGTPTFSIASGFSAVFTISSGTNGCFTLNSTSTPEDELASEFLDDTADFVFSGVRRDDKIKVGGVYTYQVTGVRSDKSLSVRRVGKGPESVAASEAAKLHLSVATTEGLRILTSRSDAFESVGGFGPKGTKIKGGDVLRVDNYADKSNSEGIFFTRKGQQTGQAVGSLILTADMRRVTFPDVNFDTTATVYNTATGVGTVIFTSHDEALVPSMYAVSTPTAAAIGAKDFWNSPLVADSESVAGAAYLAMTLSSSSITSVTGSFTPVTTGLQRVFTDASAPFGSITLPGANQYHILFKGADDVYRPMFKVVSKTNASELVVEQYAVGELNPALSATNVAYKVSQVAPGTATVYEKGGSATVSVAYSVDNTIASALDLVASYGGYALTATDRVLVADTTKDFADDGVVVGDYVFSDTGTLMFKVVRVPVSGSDDDHTLIVRTVSTTGANVSASTALVDFGFSVREKGLPVDFVVRRVVNSTQLEVREALNSPNSLNSGTAVNGFVWFQDTAETLPASVMAADVVKGVAYEVEKTVAGADLTGDILVTYAVVRNDLVGVQELTAADYVSVVGEAVPDNPLGMAAQIYFSNSGSNLFVAQVKEDTLAGWSAAAEAIKTDAVYSVVPLTSDESILAMWRAHTLTESLPDNKRERVLWQCRRFLQDVVLASMLETDSPAVSRDNDGVQTVVIGRNLVELGVKVGDLFEGTWFNGVTYQDFSGRIMAVSVIGTVTTLTMLPDGNVPLNTVDMTITAYTVTSKPLSLFELKNQIKAYPATVRERRIRNIYPDRCVLAFSDTTGDGETTGLYGGGFRTTISDNFYCCVVEAAKRTAFGPAKPLTKRGGAGIYGLLDPFVEAPGFQDELIDSGMYYMEQAGGAGSNVYALRALTTDTRELITAEESVTPQIDSFVRTLRKQLTPLLGPEILDERFFSLVSLSAQAVVSRVLAEKELKSIKLLGIRESTDTADTFLMEYEVEPYFSGARGIVTIFF